MTATVGVPGNAKVACVLGLAGTCRNHVAVGRRWASALVLAEDGAGAEGGKDPRGRQGDRRNGVRVVDTVSMAGGDEAAGRSSGKEWDGWG